MSHQLFAALFCTITIVSAQFGYDYNPYMAYGGYGMGSMGGYGGGMYNPLMYPQNAAIGYGSQMMNPYGSSMMGGYPGFMNPGFYNAAMYSSNYGNSGSAGYNNYNKNSPMFGKRLSSNTLNQNVQSGTSIGSTGCRTPFCLNKAKAKN